jgi:hypothetical protein
VSAFPKQLDVFAFKDSVKECLLRLQARHADTISQLDRASATGIVDRQFSFLCWSEHSVRGARKGVRPLRSRFAMAPTPVGQLKSADSCQNASQPCDTLWEAGTRITLTQKIVGLFGD